MTPKSPLRSPWLAGLLVLAVVQAVLALGGWMNSDVLTLSTGLIAAVLGAAGALAAFTAFSPGDYQRKVWLLLTLNSTFLLISSLLRAWIKSTGIAEVDSPLLPYRLVVVILANSMMAASLILLATTYRRSGLTPPATWRSRLAWIASLVIAVVIVAPDARHAFDVLGQGGGGSGTLAAIRLVSVTGDLITLALVVPLLRVAFLLRGGALSAVYGAIAASGAMWLIYDARDLLTHLFVSDAAEPAPVMFVFRTLALGLLGVAGIYQRRVVTRGPAVAGGPGPAATV